MGKFSDPNYDLLQRYFNILGSRQTGPQLSYISGPRSGIWTDGGAFTVLYEDNATNGFVGHKFLIQEIDGNRFLMEHKGLYQDYRKYRTSTETAALSAINVGDEMYFRKDSFFHAWLARSENIEYRDYVNQQKTFAFFGKIWSGGNRGNSDLYAIEFEGLKDYTLNALPPHNQTPNVKEWLNVYFDQVHHQPYTMLKTLWSLMDAREIDLRWLGYIAQIYGIEINEEMSELNLREWVENLIYFLKRIGTFNALYVIWKLYLTNSTNVMNVYERWDEWCQPNIWKKDTTDLALFSSFDRFPGFHPGLPEGIYSYFGPELYPINDYNWLEFYGQQPSGGAGDLWYSQFNPNSYPTHAQEAPTEDCNDLKWDCGPAESFYCYDAREMGTSITSLESFSIGLSAYSCMDSTTGTVSLSGQFISGDFEHCAGVTMSNQTVQDCSFIFYGLSNDYAGFGTDTGNWIGVAFERASIGTVKRFTIYEKYGGIVYSTVGTKTDYEVSKKYRIGIDRECTPGTVIVYIYDGRRRGARLVETITHTLHGCPNYTYLHAANGVTNGLDGEFFGTVWRQHIDLATFTWSVGPTGYPVITPHYIVEVDLNSEPLIDVTPFDTLFEGEDFIINKFVADELIRNWEYVRPVNKHVLYHELLAPPAKEERVATSVPLYPLDSNGYFDTFYTGSRFLSAGTPTPSAGVATYLHIQKIAKKTWNINHGLGSRYNVVQAWENLKGSTCNKNAKNIARRIEPSRVAIIDDNNIKISFIDAMSGWATIAGESWNLTYSHFEETQCTPGIWTVFHDFEDTPFGGLEGYPSGVGPLVNIWLHSTSSSSSSSSESSSSSSESSSSSSSSSSESSSSSSSSESSSDSSSSSSSESSSFSLSSAASTLECPHCRLWWDSHEAYGWDESPPGPLSASYPNPNNFVSETSPISIVRPTEAVTEKNDVIVFWTETPSANGRQTGGLVCRAQPSPPGGVCPSPPGWEGLADQFPSGGYGKVWGNRKDHCEDIIDPVMIWDGNDSTHHGGIYDGVRFDKGNSSDSSYMPNQGLAVFALTAPVSGNQPIYHSAALAQWGNPYLEWRDYAWVFIVDETTLARTGVTAIQPIQVDFSDHPTRRIEQVLVEADEQSFTVFFTPEEVTYDCCPVPPDYGLSDENDGWKINYSYIGTGGTRQAWYNSVNVGSITGKLARPEGIVSCMLHEDDSKYIGLFYKNEVLSPTPGDSETAIRGTITTSTGGIVNPVSEPLSETVGLGHAVRTWAVCPYKYDDAGNKMGFMLVYDRGGAVYARYMTRLATFPGDPVLIGEGLAFNGDHAWDISPTYRPDQYILVLSQSHTVLCYYIIDRGTPTLSGGGAPNIIQGQTCCMGTTSDPNPYYGYGGIGVVKNDDDWSYFVASSVRDREPRNYPLPVHVEDETARKVIAFTLGSSSSSTSSSSVSFSSSSSSESSSSSSVSSSSSSSSSSASESSSSSSVSFSSSSDSSSSTSFPCPPISDDFTGANGDPLNIQRWTSPPSGNDSCPFHPCMYEVTIFDNKASVTRPSLYWSHVADSRSKLEGDFDVQCRFSISGAPWDHDSDNLYMYAYSLPGNNDFVAIGRSKFAGYSSRVYPAGSWNSTASTDTSGGLRMTRVGDTFTTYYLVAGVWTQFVQETDASFPQRIEVRILFGNRGTSNTRWSIDNMKVNSPTYPDADFICAESISSSSSSSAQTYEDLTTHTEVDAGGYLTVTVPRVTFTTMPVNLSSDGYLYKDFGVNYFADFTVDFDWIMTNMTGDSWSWSVIFSNYLGTWFDNQINGSGVAFGVRRSVSQLYMVAQDFTLGNTQGATGLFAGSMSVVYARCSRVGSTLTYDLYSDSGRTALIVSVPQPCVITKFRYFFPFVSRGVGATPYTFTGYAENFTNQG